MPEQQQQLYRLVPGIIPGYKTITLTSDGKSDGQAIDLSRDSEGFLTTYGLAISGETSSGGRESQHAAASYNRPTQAARIHPSYNEHGAPHNSHYNTPETTRYLTVPTTGAYMNPQNCAQATMGMNGNMPMWASTNMPTPQANYPAHSCTGSHVSGASTMNTCCPWGPSPGVQQLPSAPRGHMNATPTMNTESPWRQSPVAQQSYPAQSNISAAVIPVNIGVGINVPNGQWRATGVQPKVRSHEVYVSVTDGQPRSTQLLRPVHAGIARVKGHNRKGMGMNRIKPILPAGMGMNRGAAAPQVPSSTQRPYSSSLAKAKGRAPLKKSTQMKQLERNNSSFTLEQPLLPSPLKHRTLSLKDVAIRDGEADAEWEGMQASQVGMTGEDLSATSQSAEMGWTGEAPSTAADSNQIPQYGSEESQQHGFAPASPDSQAASYASQTPETLSEIHTQFRDEDMPFSEDMSSHFEEAYLQEPCYSSDFYQPEDSMEESD